MFNTLRKLIDKAEESCSMEKAKRIAGAVSLELKELRYEQAVRTIEEYKATKK